MQKENGLGFFLSYDLIKQRKYVKIPSHILSVGENRASFNSILLMVNN
jgi:hypothetical protein